MVYRLDAMEAYNKRLVKKIAVKGISESGSTAMESYVYLESINLSKAAPTATIQFDYKGASGIRKVTRTVSEGFMNSMQLRLIEESKIHCAKEHFKAISNGEVVYDVVDSYQSLLDLVTK